MTAAPLLLPLLPQLLWPLPLPPPVPLLQLLPFQPQPWGPVLLLPDLQHL
jgi:hypothetical protein